MDAGLLFLLTLVPSAIGAALAAAIDRFLPKAWTETRRGPLFMLPFVLAGYGWLTRLAWSERQVPLVILELAFALTWIVVALGQFFRWADDLPEGDRR